MVVRGHAKLFGVQLPRRVFGGAHRGTACAGDSRFSPPRRRAYTYNETDTTTVWHVVIWSMLVAGVGGGGGWRPMTCHRHDIGEHTAMDPWDWSRPHSVGRGSDTRVQCALVHETLRVGMHLHAADRAATAARCACKTPRTTRPFDCSVRYDVGRLGGAALRLARSQPAGSPRAMHVSGAMHVFARCVVSQC